MQMQSRILRRVPAIAAGLLALAAAGRVGPVRGGVRARHRRDASRSGARGLADLAPHPRRVGLQPPRPDRPRQRGPAPHGLVARARGGAAGGHAARVPRRAVHAAVERRHRGHRRGDRRPDLAAPPQPARRRLRLRRRQRAQQPEHRHLRPVHRQHQRRRLLLRARRRDRRDRLGDADLRLQGDTRGAQLGPHHRRRPGHLRPELPAPGRARVVRRRGATTRGTGEELWRRRTVPAPGEPGDETWGDVPYEERVHVGTWMPASYDPELRLIYQGHVGHLAGPEVHARRGRPDAPPTTTRRWPSTSRPARSAGTTST